MKKSNEQRKSDRRKKRDEENFWKIMYLTSDDTDNYTHRDDTDNYTHRPKQRKLPILPFINQTRKVFNKMKGLGMLGLGVLVFSGLYYRFSEYMPSLDGGKEENTKKWMELNDSIIKKGHSHLDLPLLFEQHKDDSIIKEWNDLDLSLTIFEEKNYDQIINYFSAMKLVYATLNNFKIEESLSKKLGVKSDNTIDIFCDFLNQVRKEMEIINDCFSDFKMDFNKSQATSIYIGYIEKDKDINKGLDKDKEIKYNNQKINCRFTFSLSSCEGKNKYMVYLMNIFTKKK